MFAGREAELAALRDRAAHGRFFLGVGRVEVYHLLRTGVLDGRPDPAGDMRVTTTSIEAYEASRTSTPT